MEEFERSMHDRAFREMLLFASISSLFQQDIPTVAGARSDGISTGSESRDPATVTTSSSFMPLIDEERIVVGAARSDPVSTSRTANVVDDRADPFSGGVEGGVEYKTMAWWHAGMAMVAETVPLGILSLPSALSTLGIIPGLILLLGLVGLASYSGYVIGQFKLTHPSIHSWADAGQIILGKYGREVFGAGQLLFVLFIMGSHILTFSVMMNAITEQGACTIVFTVTGTILSIILMLPRTLRNLSYYSIASFVSIIAAVVVTMIGVSRTRSGGHADAASGRWVQEVHPWPQPDVDFPKAFLATTNMALAYAGHVAFFSFISELRDPNDFPKALALLQISDISMYIVTAVVIYYYAGGAVASRALDSISPIIRKVAYGAAIPTIVIAGVINGHVAVKYLYVRLLRNDKNNTLHQKSVKAIGLWAGLCVAVWFVAWILAESVPVFSDLLGVTGALFASWFTFGLSGILWFHTNVRCSNNNNKWKLIMKRHQKFTWKTGVAVAVNCLLVVVGVVMCVAGLYASGRNIALNNLHTGKKPFGCSTTTTS